MELHRHGLAHERAVEPGLIALADAAGIPLVATNDCYFATPDMHEAHDALLAIAEGRMLSERDRRRVTPEHWFKPAADMRILFADLPEACDNTLAIARRCAVMMETRKPLLPVSPKVHAGSTEDETVRAMAVEGLDRRMDAMAADAADPRALSRTARLRTVRHRLDGLCRLFPDRRRLHPVGEGAGHSGRPRPRFRRRARSPPGR